VVSTRITRARHSLQTAQKSGPVHLPRFMFSRLTLAAEEQTLCTRITMLSTPVCILTAPSPPPTLSLAPLTLTGDATTDDTATLLPRHAGSCPQQDGHKPQPLQPDAPPPHPQSWPRSAVRSRDPQWQQPRPKPVQRAQRVQIMHLSVCS
jgi:hypothetical protein